MKITESKLRRIIRSVIIEASDEDFKDVIIAIDGFYREL